MQNECVYCEEFATADGEAFDRILALLFAEADEICLHGEKGNLREPSAYADLFPVRREVVKTEEVFWHDKNVLRLHFAPTATMQAFFLRVRSFCARFEESSLMYAPYLYFADTLFLKNGVPLVDFTLSNNHIDCDPNLAKRVAKLYRECMLRDGEYLTIKEKFTSLSQARQRYFISTGVRLLRNLFIYREKENYTKKPLELEQLRRLNAFMPRTEWLNVAAYKSLASEVFPASFMAQLAYAETFADLCEKQRDIERVLRKLEFYLVREADTPPVQRSYVS